MRRFTAGEIAAMRSTQMTTLQDECVILRWAGYPDGLGDMVGRWTADATRTRCGFGWDRRREIPDNQKTVISGEFLIRLPAGTTLDPRDRLRIVSRFGQDIEPTDYAVDGTPAVGPSGVVVRVTQVEP